MRSVRAWTTGSSGLANGSLSMITHERASPGTCTPSQNVGVANRTAWGVVLDHAIRRPRGGGEDARPLGPQEFTERVADLQGRGPQLVVVTPRIYHHPVGPRLRSGQRREVLPAAGQVLGHGFHLVPDHLGPLLRQRG